MRVRIHAAASVANGNTRKPAGWNAQVIGFAGVQLACIQSDGQRAAFRHGIARVEGQVDQRCFHLRRVDASADFLILSGNRHVDRRRQGAFQQPAGTGYNLGKRHILGIDRLATAESKQALDQIRAALGRFEHR